MKIQFITKHLIKIKKWCGVYILIVSTAFNKKMHFVLLLISFFEQKNIKYKENI